MILILYGALYIKEKQYSQGIEVLAIGQKDQRKQTGCNVALEFGRNMDLYLLVHIQALYKISGTQSVIFFIMQ